MSYKKQTKNTLDQRGFASIVVTMIIMIVLTLIVIGFAQISRREQRAALDRQLSTQAYYAAESGINDLWAVMKDPTNHNYFYVSSPDRTKCDDSWNGSNFTRKDPNTTDGIKYTCLLYNSKASSLQYNSVVADKVTIVPITNTDLTGGSLTFKWDSISDTPAYIPPGGYKQLPQQTAWDADWPGILRVMIIPLDNDPTRQGYIDNTFTGYFSPDQGNANTVAFNNGKGATTSGVITQGKCGTGCSAKVTGLPVVDRGFYIVMRSIYATSNVEIFGNNGTTKLSGAQVVIDATGQAQDVLRRVQVRKPLNPVCNDFCPVGFTSMGPICKEITLNPGPTGGFVQKGNGDGSGECTFNFPPPLP